ncbi:MAG: thioredoxin family protein [Nitrososphaerales archaeon]
MQEHHTIEIFSAGCPLCKHVIDTIEIGKCEGCRLAIYDVNNMTKEIKVKMKEYDLKAVPTTIIDGQIKVVGIPDFPWICGKDLYKKLRSEYPLK